MKVFLYILAGLAAAACLVLALGYWVLIGAPVPSIPPSKTPPPEGFVAAEFQDIDALQSAGGLEVIDLDQHGKYFEHMLHRADGLIVFTFFGETENDDVTYAAYDTAGDLVDILNLPIPAHRMDQFFLSKDTYRALSPAGFSDAQPYAQIEGEITAQQLDQLNKDSDYYFTLSWTSAPRDSEAFKTRAAQHIFREAGVWKTLSTSIEQPYDYKGGAFGNGPDFELKTQYYHDAKRQNNGQGLLPEKAIFQLTHFDQQEYFSRKSASIGSTTGIGRAEHWRGTGYYTLTMGDGALTFKIDDDTQNLSGSGRLFLTAATHADVDYVFLKHHKRHQTYRVYLIRPVVQ